MRVVTITEVISDIFESIFESFFESIFESGHKVVELRSAREQRTDSFFMVEGLLQMLIFIHLEAFKFKNLL